jgi:hypothetical protein
MPTAKRESGTVQPQGGQDQLTEIRALAGVGQPLADDW